MFCHSGTGIINTPELLHWYHYGQNNAGVWPYQTWDNILQYCYERLRQPSDCRTKVILPSFHLVSFHPAIQQAANRSLNLFLVLLPWNLYSLFFFSFSDKMHSVFYLLIVRPCTCVWRCWLFFLSLVIKLLNCLTGCYIVITSGLCSGAVRCPRHQHSSSYCSLDCTLTFPPGAFIRSLLDRSCFSKAAVG